MMKTVKLSELFSIERGKSYFKEFIEDSNGINYVTTSGQNQGVKCKVAKNNKYEVYPAGTITVALQGSTMSAFVQTEDFILQTHVAALTPKKEMTLNEKLYYCMCIQANAFKFSFGRKANTTFSNLLVPAEIPYWVYEAEEPDLSEYKESFDNSPTPELNTDKWKEFKISDLFELKTGKTLNITGMEEGKIPYVSASGNNNGVIGYVNTDKDIFEPNAITVPIVGNSVAIAGYQDKEFVLSNNAIALYSKYKDFNKYHAMFINPILKLEKFRYGYGRKWGLGRMEQSVIKLPATPKGEPDYDYMEDYIKTLPYSKYI